MSSLFSSFDMNLYFYQILQVLAVLILIFSTGFKSNFFGVLLKTLYNFFTKFFRSIAIRPSKFMFLNLISLFLIITFLNIFSLSAYNFAFTTQVSLNLMLGLGFWGAVNIFGIWKSNKNYLSHLIPLGAPIMLGVALFLIEAVSNLIRPITLAVRLTANVMAGHLLIILLTMLIESFPGLYLIMISLTMVEVGVGIIQSYIFCTMIVLYYSENS